MLQGDVLLKPGLSQAACYQFGQICIHRRFSRMSIRGPKIFEQGLNFDGLKLDVLRIWQSKWENRIKTGKLNRARGHDASWASVLQGGVLRL